MKPPSTSLLREADGGLAGRCPSALSARASILVLHRRSAAALVEHRVVECPVPLVGVLLLLWHSNTSFPVEHYTLDWLSSI